jgi:hypothetical protein
VSIFLENKISLSFVYALRAIPLGNHKSLQSVMQKYSPDKVVGVAMKACVTSAPKGYRPQTVNVAVLDAFVEGRIELSEEEQKLGKILQEKCNGPIDCFKTITAPANVAGKHASLSHLTNVNTRHQLPSLLLRGMDAHSTSFCLPGAGFTPC